MQDPNQKLERTSFQYGGSYDPMLDIKADVAMVYGISGDVAGRVKSWKDKGYIVHLMTGVAWGEYQDYFEGRWDGKTHVEESQTRSNGEIIGHGVGIPYVSPSITYGKYLCVGVKKALDAGVEAIHLEEPEFWVASGYEANFKREWKDYYGDDWIAPDASPDAQYRASKLKYFLYRRALQQVFDFVIEYNKQNGRTVRCYVPTHSLLNYAHWGIVSPEQSLVMLKGCDGYIGQVWTGTARTPTIYAGELKERTFETGFFEYGVLHNLVRSTGRRMYFLNDPVEDNPNHTWEDYRTNWECTTIASLLWPDIWHFEVVPWPDRPFKAHFPAGKDWFPGAADKDNRYPISSAYASELLTVFEAMKDMKQPKVEWDCGTQGVGVLVSDTLMFQRGGPVHSEGNMSSFYGLALPLLYQGVPAQPVQYENIPIKDYLKSFHILYLTYEGMKPPAPILHDSLAQWVRGGGVLVFTDDDKDPYNAVKEWWNSDGRTYTTPREHLFEKLGLKADEVEGTYLVGKGTVIYRKISPAEVNANADSITTMRELFQDACKAASVPLRQTNYLILRRGPYVVAAGLPVSQGGKTGKLTGHYVNLFDAGLPVLKDINIVDGNRMLLKDLGRMDLSKPCVVAASAQVLGVKSDSHSLSFHAAGPLGTMARIRVSIKSAPQKVAVEGVPADAVKSQWDSDSKTLYLELPNAPEGHDVTISL